MFWKTVHVGNVIFSLVLEHNSDVSNRLTVKVLSL